MIVDCVITIHQHQKVLHAFFLQCTIKKPVRIDPPKRAKYISIEYISIDNRDCVSSMQDVQLSILTRINTVPLICHTRLDAGLSKCLAL